MTPLLLEVMREWFKLHPGGEFTFCKKAGEPITVQMANHHFRWALEGSTWQVIRGWHCLRHTFVSNLAWRGIDQRIIMDLGGPSQLGDDEAVHPSVPIQQAGRDAACLRGLRLDS